MTNPLNNSVRDASILTLSLLAWQMGGVSAEANPTGGSVAQGSASFNTSGSQLTINQTSASALINWSSFNIGVGETTTFVQPSATSVAWNEIAGGNPSQILGNLNANGYVVLQNQSGFVVGGDASVSAHGLVMTTSPTPAPDLSSGGAWQFNAPPPAAKIINYGQINIAGEGPVFLIASDIENHGTISAPGGQIGLYAGEQVLLSHSPDGRGLSTKVTLPQGSVDNEGRLIADAGTIVAQAQTVNNNGLVQANSVQNNNGVIELLASDSVNLGANSAISAQGGSTGISSGGAVTVKSDNAFSDQAGSTINIAGGAQGGNGGEAEICAPQMSSIQSVIHGQAAAGYVGGVLTIDPLNIWLASATTDPSAPADYTVVDVNSYSGLSAINVLADDNITLNTLWNLSSLNTPATLSLTATTGNITFNAGSGIVAPENAQDNWSINLTAGNTIALDGATATQAGARIQADAGRISMNAASVNLYGTLQANSIGQANGVIDVNASGDLAVGAASVISAQGDPTSANPSPGGFVTLQAGGSYSDTSSSIVNVTGQNGGQAGIVEIFGNNLNGNAANPGVNSSFTVTPFALLINPYYISLSQNPTGTSQDGNYNNFEDANFFTGTGVFPSDLAAYTQIDLHSLGNIELSAPWTLYATATPASLSLTAGNSIILDAGTSLEAVNLNANLQAAENNWGINLRAGTGFVPSVSQPTPPAGGGDGTYSYGVYLDDGAILQTQAGNINVWGANEVIVHNVDLSSGAIGGSITTHSGGNINVTAEYGDVNTGNNIYGYKFGQNSTSYPYYYKVSPSLGGISTAAGGNVTIAAGGDVNSYLPTQSDYESYFNNNTGAEGDAGTGAFGTQPGNVSITAGGSVYGNYVVANGVGTINAGQNAGVAITSISSLATDFALSLIKGSWSVYAQNIYLDDVMNPNGVFNDSATRTGKKGAHVFDYDPESSLLLDAADAVEITGAEVPLLPTGASLAVPVLLPPTLQITTGAGGLTLDTDVILFPSAEGNVNITTLDDGNFESRQNPDDPYDFNTYSLQMSDTGPGSPLSLANGLGTYQWSPGVGNNEANEIFGYGDHAPTPPELNNPNPVEIDVSGSINNVTLYTTKATDLTVGVNMFNASLVGENLHASDSTSIKVAGSISFSPIYTLTSLTQPIVSADPLSSAWDSIFSVVVDTTAGDPNSTANPIPSADIGNNGQLKNLATGDLIFPNGDPGFVYSPGSSPGTGQLGYAFQMSSLVRGTLEGTMKMIVLNSAGVPEVQLGQASLGQDPTQYYFVTTPVSFAPASVIEALYNESRGLNANGTPNPNGEISVANAQSLPPGFQIGGPGTFNISAGTIELGSSGGIISWGVGDGTQQPGGVNYASLAALGSAANSGAAINVDATGNLSMLTSTIASLAGGNVTVESTDGEIDLGLASLPFSPPNSGNVAYGIYTSGSGDVNVTAAGDINIDSARIATFNGGSVFVESLNGDVNAGNGVNEDLLIPVVFYDSKTGQVVNDAIQSPRPYGSGIMALSPTEPYQVSPGTTKGGGELPGNITVETPDGDIVSTLGGISQFALNGSIAGGPMINLSAGTPGTPGSKTEGNIELGQGGVVGGTVNLTAQGSISGLIVSRQNSTVTAAQNVNVTVLSGGNANVSAGGNLSGTLIGVSGVSASGGEGISATMLSGNVSANGAAAQSTLGTATASSASQSAANQSNSDTKQQLASDNTGSDDDDKKKKKGQTLMQKLKRVTVLLPRI